MARTSSMSPGPLKDGQRPAQRRGHLFELLLDIRHRPPHVFDRVLDLLVPVGRSMAIAAEPFRSATLRLLDRNAAVQAVRLLRHHCRSFDFLGAVRRWAFRHAVVHITRAIMAATTAAVNMDSQLPWW